MTNKISHAILEAAMNPSRTQIFTELGESPADLLKVDFPTDRLLVVPMEEGIVFPGGTMPMQINDDEIGRALREADKSGMNILLTPYTEGMDGPLFLRRGTIGRLMKILELPDGSSTAFIVCMAYGTVADLTTEGEFYYARVDEVEYEEIDVDNRRVSASMMSASERFLQFLSTLDEDVSREMKFAFSQLSDPLRALHFMLMHVPMTYTEKLDIYTCLSTQDRLLMLSKCLSAAVQLFELKADISRRTRADLSRQQREMFLQQQIRSIQDELGGDDEVDDMEELRSRSMKMLWGLPQREHFDKELRKLQRFNPSSPDYAVQYAYLDTLLNLPWQKMSDSRFSLNKVARILNRDHFGLEKVKERILEHMAVLSLRGDQKASILCLYGPPGVGKTSLGKSIADALGREYCRVSFGGLHDESEIRGHRRTYIGAMPGRIISALAKCGTNNPVFVLDEIDKIGSDYKGDPSTALLEVLDPEQNSKFHDNYLNVDYDLSNVLFIATANSLSTISRPLLDRMELIEISGYMTQEKVQIAQKHLTRKALLETGLMKEDYSGTAVTFDKAALTYLVERYTRESGVRQLYQEMCTVLRKIVRLLVSNKPFPTVIKPEDVRQLLGPEKYSPDEYDTDNFVGVVTGLAWTAVGGEILFIETSLAPAEKGGALTLTGNLGDVMKESATIALQYLKAHAEELGIDQEKFTRYNIHIHVPEGAIPKDGPSAGITMTTALASALTGRRVREKLAMTGETTLRGKVLPVGGIKEKILAAKRAGIKAIILSERNRKDIEEIPAKYLKGLSFLYVNTVDEVLRLALGL